MKVQKTVLAAAFTLVASVSIATENAKESQTFADGLSFLASGEIYKGIDAIQDAAKNGDVFAQYNLGDLYSRGVEGLDKNTELAMVWLKKASDNGLDIAKKQYEYIDSLVSEATSK